MRTLSIFFIFFICLISVLIICFLERWTTNFFLIPIVESFFIFIAILFLYKYSQENLISICFIFAIFFVLFENGVYALAIALNMIERGYKEVLSWRFLYNFLFILIYIPILCFGLKYKDKFLWVLFFVCGTCLHLVFNLVMEVIS